MRLAVSFVAPVALAALLTSPARAESPGPGITQNDCYRSGEPAYLPGLRDGDIIAARLRAGFGAVIALDILYGGSAPAVDPLEVEIKVWDDTAETNEPGPEIYSGRHTLFSQTRMQRILLPGFQAPERFRVGVVLDRDAPPSVGQDTDGTISTDDNFVFTAADGWRPSAAMGATGDWVIRASLSSGEYIGACAGTGGGGGGVDGGVDRDGFDGAPDVDLGAGCCQSSAGAGPGASLLGLGVLAALLRRRRR